MLKNKCQALQCGLWGSGASLDTTDISLRDTAPLGKLDLCKPTAHSCISELDTKRDPGGEGGPESSVLRSVGSLRLGQVVAELGPHSACSGCVSPNDNLQNVIGRSARLRDDLDTGNLSALKYAERHSERAGAYVARECGTTGTRLICQRGAVL